MHTSPLSEDAVLQAAQQLAEALEASDFKTPLTVLQDLKPGDVAQVVHTLSPPQRTTFVSHLWQHLDGEFFTYLDKNICEELVPLIPPEGVAKMIHNLESDDAFSILDELSDMQKADVLEAMSRQERHRFEKFEHYPKESAARMMQQEIVAVPAQWTVADVRRYLNTHKKGPHVFHNIFLVDKQWRLLGAVPLAKLVRASANEALERLVEKDICALRASEDREEIALNFKRYALIAAPVVDEDDRLLGVITADDVLNVVDQEAEEDIMHLGGVGASDFYAPVVPTTLARFKWLLVTFFNTLLASMVIAQFQDVLEKKVALAILMPIVGAMGGNAGTQVVTVMVRAISTHELTLLNMGRTLAKGTIVSLLNGALFALILSVITALWFQDPWLGVTLGSALLINMVWAGVGGTLLPILVDHAGLDPALSAGPLLTTTTDVLGFAVFLGLANVFLF